MAEDATPAADPDTPRVLRLNKQVKEVPFELDDGDGNVESYVLREMSSPQRDKYLEEYANRFKVNANGAMVGIKDFKGVQSKLIAKCCFTAAGAPVSQGAIDTWPPTAQSALYKVAMKINCLTEDEVEAEKKE